MKLAPNKDKALAVYKTQVKKLSKDEYAKNEMIKSEAKLQQLGFVDFLSNLTPEQQERIQNAPLQIFLPWRPAYNANSVTTEWRLVFDGSQPTATSYSLNDCLAKGRNNLNKLVEIFLRWTTHTVAFHCDVRKMYNSVALREEDWVYQLYIWQKDLDPDAIPEIKVIKTVIYGLRPSGNQAETGLRRTAELSKNEFPEVKETVDHDIYVDDGMSGDSTHDAAYQLADELDLVLKRGNFHLKGFTFSGKPPLEELSKDGVTVSVAGMVWKPEPDVILYDVKELSFVRRKRGRKPDIQIEIPERLTRRQCMGKVAELFDITGKVTPIIAHMKLDIRTLLTNELDWDDPIPSEFREIWIQHFNTIQELKDVQFRRCIIPEDAVNTDIHTIDTADASNEVACSAIYARVLRSTGEYSCQLAFARSKLLPPDTTQPRAELTAAVMNAHTGEVVKRSFGTKHKSAIKLTDSQIVLHWLNNLKLLQEIFVRNRIIEVHRFTLMQDWYYVRSADMVADLGTRRGATINDIVPGSIWNTGFEWMSKPQSEFPIFTYEEVKNQVCLLMSTFFCALVCVQLCTGQVNQAQEQVTNQEDAQTKSAEPQVYVIKPETFVTEAKKRYKFSDYIYDPHKYSYPKSLRVIAYIQRFVRGFCQKYGKNLQAPVPSVVSAASSPNPVKYEDVDPLTDDELNDAASYYYWKASLEVKHFAKSNTYKKISFERDSILHYKGRILPSQTIQSVVPLTEAMKDLTSMKFCVPLVDKYSPIGLSVVSDIHWNHKVA